MGKTKRKASIWWESRFNLGDPRYPEDKCFFDVRFQRSIQNKNRNLACMFIDPRSMKTIHWAEYGKWAKTAAKRAARHNAKILVALETHIIMDELQQEIMNQIQNDDDWWDDHPMDFSCFYSDEAAEYLHQRLEEEMLEAQREANRDTYFDGWNDFDWDY